MSDAIAGSGTLLLAGDGGSPEVFTAVAEQVTLKMPQYSRNEIETSILNEGEDDKILGILRKGQVTGTLNWLPTNATHSDSTGMLYDLLNNTARNWRIAVAPLGLPHWTFQGKVQLFDVQEISVDSALQVAFALTVTGTIVRVNS